MGKPRFIQTTKYLTHHAQWQTTALDNYGQPTVLSSPTTVPCFYYVGSVYRDKHANAQGLSRAVEDQGLEHLMLLPDTVTVQMNDIFGAITSQDGDLLQSTGRVVRIEDFHGWKNGRGLLMRQVTLELN